MITPMCLPSLALIGQVAARITGECIFMCGSVSVCFPELTALTAMAAEVTEPEEMRSLVLTAGNLACSKCGESTASGAPAAIRWNHTSSAIPRWLNNVSGNVIICGFSWRRCLLVLLPPQGGQSQLHAVWVMEMLWCMAEMGETCRRDSWKKSKSKVKVSRPLFYQIDQVIQSAPRGTASTVTTTSNKQKAKK